MLSRTADSLFWLARYMERAENMARLIDMGRRMTAIPLTPGAAAGAACRRRNEWPSILAATGCADSFVAATGVEASEASQAHAIPHLIVDRTNHSSVVSCFEAARGNARSARAALTKDMWEAVNDVWHAFRALRADQLKNGSISPLLDRIKGASAQFRGAADSSALRNDGHTFLRLGLAIERIDNMARLLDVKCFMTAADGVADDAAWAAILRAAGVDRAYHMVYRADYTPARVFDFLVHNPQCPRSLRHSASDASRRIADLIELYGARKPCADVAEGLSALIDHAKAVDLDPVAAHEFLTAIIRRNNALAMQVAEDHHFAPKPPPSEADAAESAADGVRTAPRRPRSATTTGSAALTIQSIAAAPPA